MFSQLEHLDKYKSNAKVSLRCQQERCENCCSLNTKCQKGKQNHHKTKPKEMLHTSKPWTGQEMPPGTPHLMTVSPNILQGTIVVSLIKTRNHLLLLVFPFEAGNDWRPLAEVPQEAPNSLLQLPGKKSSNIFGDCCLQHTVTSLIKDLVSLF